MRTNIHDIVISLPTGTVVLYMCIENELYTCMYLHCRRELHFRPEEPNQTQYNTQEYTVIWVHVLYMVMLE